MLKKPQNVYLPIDKFQAKVFKQDEDKRGEWVTNFALALAEEAEDGFAKELLRKAQADLYKDILRGWRFNARRSLETSGVMNPTDLQVHEKCIEEFGDEYVEALELLTATSKRIRDNVNKRLDQGSQEDSGARESTRTDGHSLRVGNVARPPVRSGRNSRCPNSREEFHAFVADNKLHEGLAEEWYAMHEARGWVDRDGKPIKDWKGALYTYCTTTEQNRRTA